MGTLIGGVLVSRVRGLREKLHVSSRLVLVTLPITIGCMIALMFLSCDLSDNTPSIVNQ